MTRKPEEIITDEEIVAVHGFANFGIMTPREVVNDGVRKYAIGYSGGYTQQTILREHGLITKSKGYSADLTKKGKEYARAIDATAVAEIDRLKAEVGSLTALLNKQDKARERNGWNDAIEAAEAIVAEHDTVAAIRKIRALKREARQ